MASMTDTECKIENLRAAIADGLADVPATPADFTAAAEVLDAFFALPTSTLVVLARLEQVLGAVAPVTARLAGAVLARQGMDRDGNWIGFPKALRVWRSTT